MRKVFIGQPGYMTLCKEGARLLTENGLTLCANPTPETLSREKALEMAKGCLAVIGGLEKWDLELINAAGDIKIIARFGAGVENVDIHAATLKGIWVTNAPGQNAKAVADMTVGLMLSLVRRIPFLDRSVKAGEWPRETFGDLDGKTIGLLGFGNVAKQTAKRLAGFDASVLAWDKYPDEKAAKLLNVKLTDFETLLSQSDIISLHLPLIPSTRHIIDDRAIKLMKPTAIIINTARGSLIDQNALYASLSSGAISSAGLDVFEDEPLCESSPLRRLNNIVLTPHCAGNTYQANESIGLTVARDIIAALNGERPSYPVNDPYK